MFDVCGDKGITVGGSDFIKSSIDDVFTGDCDGSIFGSKSSIFRGAIIGVRFSLSQFSTDSGINMAQLLL